MRRLIPNSDSCSYLGLSRLSIACSDCQSNLAGFGRRGFVCLDCAVDRTHDLLKQVRVHTCRGGFRLWSGLGARVRPAPVGFLELRSGFFSRMWKVHLRVRSIGGSCFAV